jgi:multiple antibiotic resistance protein
VSAINKWEVTMGSKVVIQQLISSYFFGGLVSLLAITNPLSKIPLFLGLTKGMDADERQKHARKACIYAFVILTTSLFGGVLIMKGFGISYGALRIAGGLTVGLLGYRMLFQTAENRSTGHTGTHIAFFPLAMPGISGPGSIAVVIGISTEIAELKIEINEAAAYTATVASIMMTCLFIWMVLRFAQLIDRWIGQEGMDALSRLMGFLMICIGVQLVGSGIRTFMTGG